jgi:transposase InsO family protein
MPWKICAPNTAYFDFIAALRERETSFAEVCRQHGICRQTGYKWWRRFLRHGGEGLRELSRRPRRLARQYEHELRSAVAELQRRYPCWGAKKIVWALRQRWPKRALPHPRTVERWAPPRPRCARRISLWRSAPPRQTARRPHDIWTIDFKGWFRTADGSRCEPLTVRDAHTCYLLHARHVPAQSERAVRRVLTRLFQREGLPRIIHVDNGAPFGGTGALGLTRLSVWWLQLGIRVQFSRPGCPGDNAAHEQMHRILKAEAATPPAPTLAAQNRRLERWRQRYNQLRPHEALGQMPPALHYRVSRRRFPTTPPPWSYPATTLTRRVSQGGWIHWQGRRRLIGRAFATHRIALTARSSYHLVHLGPHRLGELHANDDGGLRPWRYCVLPRQAGAGEEPSPSPATPSPI